MQASLGPSNLGRRGKPRYHPALRGAFMRPLPDRARALSLAVVFCLVSGSSLLVAQVPQEAGAPPSDISNIPKPVISTVDSINMRDGINDTRTKPKAAQG